VSQADHSVYKGAPNLNLDELSEVTVALAIVLTGLVIAILSVLFWLPYVYCKVVRKDYTLKWYHFFLGPMLWSRQAPADAHDRLDFVPDYRVQGRDDAPKSADPASPEKRRSDADVESKGSDSDPNVNMHAPPLNSEQIGVPEAALADVEKDRKDKIEGPWILPRNLWIILRYKVPYVLFYGANVDVHARQLGTGKEADRRAEMHQYTKQYPNETEHLYSFLQVMTSCTQAFAHGSNDVANAIGPFAAIYYIWKTGLPTDKNTETPVWMLAFGGAMIVIGLATYGYNMMISLGNKITLHSPSRGFSMEFGASITVILASQFGIPVSTTMCIVGATTGVGIISGGFRAVNWLHLAKIWAGWIATIPLAGVLAGCLTGFILNAPKW
jgi:sodium-dependent phosphate transporter